MVAMKLHIRNKRELTFLAIGILMLFILVTLAIFSISFVVDQLRAGLRSEVITEPTIRFEFYKTEELKKR